MHMHDADSSGLKGACGFPLHAFLVFSSALNWIQSERTDGTWTGRQTVDVAIDGRHLFKRLSEVLARIQLKRQQHFRSDRLGEEAGAAIGRQASLRIKSFSKSDIIARAGEEGRCVRAQWNAQRPSYNDWGTVELRNGRCFEGSRAFITASLPLWVADLPLFTILQNFFRYGAQLCPSRCNSVAEHSISNAHTSPPLPHEHWCRFWRTRLQLQKPVRTL